MQLVTADKMKEIVDLWCDDTIKKKRRHRAPEGKFYCKDGDTWIGCDNSSGDCWVEEFKTEEDVVKWLNGENVYDANNSSLNK